MVVFRCDGDDRVGAGHVSRCLQIAKALIAPGTDVSIVGRLEGIAAELAATEAIDVLAPDPDAPAGIPDGAAAAVVDSYEIPTDELTAVAARRPLCVVLDDG